MRQISSFLGVLLLGLMIQAGWVQAQSINTTLGTVTGVCVGDTVVVPVTVTMASGISTSAISMAIDYDTTKLRCISSVTSLNSNIATGFLSNCGLFFQLESRHRAVYAHHASSIQGGLVCVDTGCFQWFDV